MEEEKRNRHTGRKIWYGTAITLSVLVLVISVLGVVGAWIVEQSLVDVTQSLLSATARTAGGLRGVVAQIDQETGDLRQISQAVSEISLRVGENIEDKGLAATLLPAEQERKLSETTGKIQERLSTVREFITSAIATYQSINRLPFVDLPTLSEERVVEIVQAVSDIQAAVADLRQSVQDFRSGVAQGVGRITEAANRLTDRLDRLSAMLAELDQTLAALQELALRLEQTVPTVFGLIALILTLFMAYVAYTQVEFIRLEVRRWRALNAPPAPVVAATAAEAEPPATAATPADSAPAAASAKPPAIAASAAEATPEEDEAASQSPGTDEQ